MVSVPTIEVHPLGHYKAALQSNDITEFHLNIINFARKNNCPPHHWYVSIQLRLEKISGSPYIDKLRMIVLLEYDMNLQFGITINRQMTWKAEDTGALDTIPQFGTRPGFQAISAVILKTCTFDIIQTRKENATMTTLNAKSCFDMVHPGYGMMAI